MDKVVIWLTGGVAALMLAGCAKPTCVRVERSAVMLARHYPAEYPSQAEPNTVIRTLSRGRYRYRGEFIGKDYLMFEIQTADGTRGWVEADGSVWHEKADSGTCR